MRTIIDNNDKKVYKNAIKHFNRKPYSINTPIVKDEEISAYDKCKGKVSRNKFN